MADTPQGYELGSGYDSEKAPAENAKRAGSDLLLVVALVVALLLLHAGVVSLWGVLPWTRKKPLPGLLMAPMLEIQLLDTLLTPACINGAILLVQDATPQLRVAGALALLIVAAYVGFLALAVLAVCTRQGKLGLKYIKYVKTRKGTAAASDGDAELPVINAAEDPNSRTILVPEGTGLAENEADAAAAAAGEHGYWEMVDEEIQSDADWMLAFQSKW